MVPAGRLAGSRIVSAPTAYLRVYEPLAAFTPGERRQLEMLAGERTPSTAEAVEAEERLGVVLAVAPQWVPRLAGDVPSSVHRPPYALVRRVDGLTLACPLRTAVRAWLALEDFRTGLPDLIVDAFVPRPVQTAALERLEAWRAHTPTAALHVRAGTWRIPLAWFAAFDPHERQLVLGGPRSLRYETALPSARRRVRRVLDALRSRAPTTGSLAEIAGLARWLDRFGDRGMVELDYGGLVSVLSDERMRADASVADTAAAVEALSEDRPQDAAKAYERLILRWREVANLEVAN